MALPRGGRYDYWVAANGPKETGNPESVRQDYERFTSYGESWVCEGVKVRVTLTTDDGFSKVIESAGLWGIESDSGEAYFESVAEDEWGEVFEEVVTVLVVDPRPGETEDDTFDAACGQAAKAFAEAEWTDKEWARS